MKRRLGFEEHGLPAGKRGLRDSEKKLDMQFKEPLKFAVDVLVLIFMVFYVLIRNYIRRFNPKPKSIMSKVCFVTGSGRGLGRGICIALAKEGAILACADINEEDNSKTVEILTEMGAKAKAYTVNVANKQEVDALAKKVESDLGRVYLVVNNAAIVMPHPEPDEEYTRAVFGVNTLGAIWTTWAFLPNMKKHNDGHIVNISSVAAVYGAPGASMYSSTKAALTRVGLSELRRRIGILIDRNKIKVYEKLGAYAQSLRLELRLAGYDNIHVTSLHPGLINTSADYMDMLKWRFSPNQVDRTAKFVINSIKYNRTDATNSPMVYFFGSLGKCMPMEVVDQAMKALDVTLTLPSVEEYRDLSVSNIIEEVRKVDKV